MNDETWEGIKQVLKDWFYSSEYEWHGLMEKEVDDLVDQIIEQLMGDFWVWVAQNQHSDLERATVHNNITAFLQQVRRSTQTANKENT